MTYVPLHCHTMLSLLDGLSKPHQVAARTRHIGAPACAITDHGNVSGVPAFQKAMSAACKHCGNQPDRHADGGKGPCVLKGVECPGYEKAPLKAILGEEFYLCKQSATQRDNENRSLSHLCVLAKNKDGWRNLVQASTASNRPEHYYYKPRLSLTELAAFAKGNWVTFSGHPGSDLANICFADPKAAYGARTYEEARGFVKDQRSLKKDVTDLAGLYRELFGPDNFFLEIQLIDHQNCPAAGIVASILRDISRRTGIPCVATPDAHYPTKEDAKDQRVLLCSAIDTTLAEAERKLAAGEDIGLGGFFRSNRYHIPSYEEMAEAGQTAEELANTLRIAEMCEPYDILKPPQLPRFECPAGKSPDQYLREICRDGWNRKVEPLLARGQGSRAEYSARIREELATLTEVGLAPYFLIVRDYNKYAQEVLGCPKDPGRGSAAGCLVSYLADITDTDPVLYELSFVRFFNRGRHSPEHGRYAMPDIDSDFPSGKRDQIIEYVRTKYGDEHVAQMATFAELQGREAITAVLRAHSWGSFEDRKKVTAAIPDKAAISDELQDMMEEEGEASSIRWTLENKPDALREYCTLNEDGTLEGPLAAHFEQAMRLEGNKKSQGRHPSGIVISPTPLRDEVPMVYDKSTKRMVTGFDMHGVEAAGILKFDILATRASDKILDACVGARTGRVS